MLASWASDAWAVISSPALRWPRRLKAPVRIDEILEALRELDYSPPNPPGGSLFVYAQQNARLRLRSKRWLARRLAVTLNTRLLLDRRGIRLPGITPGWTD